jgi:hypothetical protein
MHRHNDGLRIIRDHLREPPERLAADDAAGITPKWPTADRLGGLVAVAHHDEQQIAHTERVALPSPLDGIPG